MGIKKLEVMKNIYGENTEMAVEINKELSDKGVFAVNVMGAPGAGKTSTLIQIIKRLNGIKPFVVEGDIESDIDTRTLISMGVEAIQINTHGACHLDSIMLRDSLKDLKFADGGMLFIENVGNLVCPAEFVIGEHVKMLICSVTEGSDKPYKYPLAFEKADLIVLNKCDLKPYLDFDGDFFYNGVRNLNGNMPVFEVSAKTGEGFEALVKWLENKVK
ncbi:MAG: hydrogenase nickel incorporation protein HypB [Pseudomonadota bacterium]